MKRFAGLIVSLLLFCVSGAAQQLDSAVQAALGSKLAEYFMALEYEGPEVQKEEADFLIESSSDPLVRQFIACTVYDHYIGSPVMGSEAVALHVFDRWFSDGKIRMRSDMDFLNARIFADFNRQSMIGEIAPELVMKSMDGTETVLFADDAKSGRYRVLFFYDVDCAKCKLESIMLSNVLETEDFPIDFIAVYAGDDKAKWEEYVAGRLSFDVSRTMVVHLWDPEIDSDFQRKYGVLKTPMMFLISPEGKILGRGLDAQALSAMLHGIFDEVELEYGGEESHALFEGLFDGQEGSPDRKAVTDVADYIETATLSGADTVMFRQLTGDLLYYLAGQRGEGYKEGMKYLVDEKILSRGDIWRSKDDSLKVVGFAQMMDELLSKALPGEKICDVKVPGELLRSKKSRDGWFRLRKLRGQKNFIIFYTSECEICKAEKAAASVVAASDRKVRVLMVNVDEIVSDDPPLADSLFDEFDLSALPFVLETDRKGIILRRYITLVK